MHKYLFLPSFLLCGLLFLLPSSNQNLSAQSEASALEQEQISLDLIPFGPSNSLHIEAHNGLLMELAMTK